MRDQATSTLITLLLLVVGSVVSPAAATTITCESKDGRRAICPVDTSGGVELVRTLSRASCEGRWGTTDEGIWVDEGCRAEFRVASAAAPTDQSKGLFDALLEGLSDEPGEASRLRCESRDARRQYCPVDTSGGVKLARQLSRASCQDTWGFDAGGIWVDKGCRAEFEVGAPVASGPPDHSAPPVDGVSVVCESRDGRRVFCPCNTSEGVELVRTLDRTPCAGHWGYGQDGIWVESGCRAEFRVAGPANAPPGEGTTRRIQCKSQGGRRAYCPVDTSGGVRFVRQLGPAPCASSWGQDSGGVWVINNCHAEFEVTLTAEVEPRPSVKNEITCRSVYGTRQHCPASVTRAIRLTRELGPKGSCLGNWGFDEQGIWVQGGCDGVFVVE